MVKRTSLSLRNIYDIGNCTYILMELQKYEENHPLYQQFLITTVMTFTKCLTIILRSNVSMTNITCPRLSFNTMLN